MQKLMLLSAISSVILLAQNPYYYKNNHKIDLEPVNNMERGLQGVKYYKNANGMLLGVDKNILVKIKEESDINSYTVKYKLKEVNRLTPTLYLVKNMGKRDTLDVANMLAKEEGVVYAHPDFIKQMFGR